MKTIAFKHGIINYKDIGTVFRIRWNNGISDDFGGRNRCETNPVDLDHLHKMIHRILCKSRSIMVSNQVHVNAYVKKISRNRYWKFSVTELISFCKRWMSLKLRKHETL